MTLPSQVHFLLSGEEGLPFSMILSGGRSTTFLDFEGSDLQNFYETKPAQVLGAVKSWISSSSFFIPQAHEDQPDPNAHLICKFAIKVVGHSTRRFCLVN